MSEKSTKTSRIKDMMQAILISTIASAIVAGTSAYVHVRVATATLDERLSRVEETQAKQSDQLTTVIRLEERMNTLIRQLDKLENRWDK